MDLKKPSKIVRCTCNFVYGMKQGAPDGGVWRGTRCGRNVAPGSEWCEGHTDGNWRAGSTSRPNVNQETATEYLLQFNGDIQRFIHMVGTRAIRRAL